MHWTERTTTVAGIALLLLAVTVIIDAALEVVAIGDANPLARGDVEAMLRDINDNETVFYVGNAFALLADGVALLAVAAVLYTAFRDRNPALSIFVFASLIGAAVSFLAADSASISLGLLSADFVKEGGPGGIAAGDPAILQSARTVAAFTALIDLVGLTLLAAGLMAFGFILAWAPQGELNPPRWFGGLLVFSTMAMLLTWVFLLEENIGFAASAVGIVGSLVFIVMLGGWLLVQPAAQTKLSEPSPEPARV